MVFLGTFYQASSKGEPQTCPRLHAKFGEVWRGLANVKPDLTFTRVPVKVPRIRQSSGEGAFGMWVAF